MARDKNFRASSDQPSIRGFQTPSERHFEAMARARLDHQRGVYDRLEKTIQRSPFLRASDAAVARSETMMGADRPVPFSRSWDPPAESEAMGDARRPMPYSKAWEAGDERNFVASRAIHSSILQRARMVADRKAESRGNPGGTHTVHRNGKAFQRKNPTKR